MSIADVTFVTCHPYIRSMGKIASIVSDLCELPLSDVIGFEQCFTWHTYQKGDHLLNETESCKYIYFVVSGIVRQCYHAKGKQVTAYFAVPGSFTTSFQSFVSGTSSKYALEAVTDVTVLRIGKSQLEAYYHQNPRFLILGKTLAEENYLCVSERQDMLQIDTAKEKWQWFVQQYDKEHRMQMPLKMVASFLGIEPETLSRVKKKSVDLT
ncbi:MAG: Crp/Fnr family transcriptional regulator [Cyclobacteriaceae bacterium]